MIFSFDEFELDPDKLELRRANKPVKADAVVLRLLAALVRDAGRLVTKQELLSGVWDDRRVSDNVITVAMARLRRTLGQTPDTREFIATVHGQGYRFVRPTIALDAQLDSVVAPAASVSSAAPLVGRERALDRLRVALDAARAGHGGVCFVTGEAGIGKTRVAEVLAQEAAKFGLHVAWGYCHETGQAPPLWPFAQLARELIAQTSLSAQDARLASALPDLARLLPELVTAAASRDTDAALQEASPPGQHRMFDAMLRVFAAAADDAPCVLVLDDLHRADAPSLELLRYWIDEIARARVLVLATVRSDAFAGPAKASWTRLVGHRNCTRVALERLQPAEVATYVGALLDDPTGALARAVFEKSEGNPFFMAELARQALAGEHLATSDAALELMRQRIATLDEATRGVLSCAAVVGRSFELTVLQAAADRDGSTLMASLDDALASEVLIAAPDSKTAFTFGHELFRTVLYDALLPADRRQWHLRVAQALNALERAGGAIASAELAHHFYSALPESDLHMAIRYCSQAATDCAAVYAYTDAVRHLRHAREALSLLHKPSLNLRIDLLLLQTLYARIGSSPEFPSLAHEAIELARKNRAGTALAQAALMLDLHPGFPPLPGAREALEDAQRLLPPDDPLQASVLARLSTSAPLAYDAEQSGQQITRALELALAGGSMLGVYTARSAQLYLMGGPAHEQVAAEVLHALDEQCRQHPTKLSAAPLSLDLHRAITALQRGDRVAMHAALERCELRARRVGHRELLWHTERFTVLSRIDPGAGQALSGADVALLRALHVRAAEDRLIGTQVLCAYDQCVVFGTPATVLADGARAALAFDEHDPPNLWALKLRALAAVGLHDDVRIGLRALPPERLASLPCDRDYLGTLAALARAALAAGVRPYAAPLHALLSPYADRNAVNVTFVSEGPVAAVLDALAQALGQQDA